MVVFGAVVVVVFSRMNFLGVVDVVDVKNVDVDLVLIKVV